MSEEFGPQGLDTIRVKRETALTKIKENADIHWADYKEALAGYKLKLKEHFEQCGLVLNMSMDKAEDVPHFKQMPRAPQHHSEEYKKFIQMLEWSEDEYIYLEQDEFQKLIMDEWDWSAAWNHTKVLYSNAG